MLPGQVNPFSVVDIGAKALTDYYGNDEWMEKIWFKTLDLADGHKCVLGQVFGEYAKGVQEMFDDENTEAALHGFLAMELKHTCWDDLNDVCRGYGMDIYKDTYADDFSVNSTSLTGIRDQMEYYGGNCDCMCECGDNDCYHFSHSEDCNAVDFRDEVRTVYNSCESCQSVDPLLTDNEMYEILTMVWIEYIDMKLTEKWLNSLSPDYVLGPSELPPHWGYNSKLMIDAD